MKRQRFLFLVMLVIFGSCFASAQQFGPWSAPVNVGPPVNSVVEDFQPFITKDGLSLYFIRGTGAAQDIWVAHRATTEAVWETPQPLPATINGPTTTEATPFVSVDGHWLYFASNRAGGFGRNDIYVSWRPNKRVDAGPGGWQAPVNLGAGVNTGNRESSPTIFEDEESGLITLYFQRDGSGSDDIYASVMEANGVFGAAQPVLELNTVFTETQPSVSRNGREIYFTSNQPGSIPNTGTGQPSLDIWVATRESTSDAWSVPVNVTALNSPFHDGRPSLSFDGSTLYFFSAFREGNQSIFFDIWLTTREMLTGPPNE